MNFNKLLSILYLLILVFCLSLISYISYYLYASTIDGNFNSFYKTAIQSLKLNYNVLNGRWAQGLTNDFRFHTNRFLITTLNNTFFLFSIFYFVKQFFKKNSIIITAVIYFTFLINAHNLYQITHLLNTSLSYTFGISLMFIFFALYFRNKRIKDKYTKPAIVVSFIILFFITGLVEHLFMIMLLILGFFVFEDVLRSLKYKKNIINVLNILYLFTALLGSVLVVFSTGSIKRRQQTSNRLETTEYSGTFDINRFLESLGDKILDLLNFNSFLFLIFMIVLLSVLKQNKNLIFSKTDQKPKAILFLAFAFVLTITPITVGFIASNGKVGMPKAYNLTAILFLVFLSALAYIINVYVTFKVRKKMFYLIISLPFVFYTFSYFMPENNLYRQQDQVFSGNLRASYEEEYARRQYLIETNMLYKEKVIPKLSMKYNNKVYAAHKYPKMNRYYSRAFNNGIPIYTDDNLPSPLEYTSLFLVKNNKLKPVFSQNGYNVYYNLKLHTLVIKHNKTLFNQPLTNFTIEIKSKKDTTESITVNLNDRYKKKTLYYSENPKFLATVLPRDVKQISIKEFEGFNIDIETNSLQEKITYSFPYGNIMR